MCYKDAVVYSKQKSSLVFFSQTVLVKVGILLYGLKGFDKFNQVNILIKYLIPTVMFLCFNQYNNLILITQVILTETQILNTNCSTVIFTSRSYNSAENLSQ